MMKMLPQKLGIGFGMAAIVALGAIDAQAQQGTWVRAQSQLATATKLASVAAINNQIAVLGGRNGGTALGAVQVVTIAGGRAMAVQGRPVLPGELRDGGAAAVCADIVLQSGGSENSGRTRVANETLGFDFDGNPRAVSFLRNPTQRVFGTAGNIGNTVFVISGEIASGATTSVQSVDCGQLNLNAAGGNRGALGGATFAQAPAIPTAVVMAATASLPDRLVVTGGRASSTSGPGLNTVQIFQNGAWRMGPQLQQARFGHVAIALSDNEVLVAGGSSDGTTALNSAEIINLTTNQVTPAANLPAPVVFANGAPAGMNRVIVVGGSRGAGANDASLTEILEFSR